MLYIMPGAVRLNVAFYLLLRECQYAECHYAECRYAECRHAESRGTFMTAGLLVVDHLSKY